MITRSRSELLACGHDVTLRWSTRQHVQTKNVSQKRSSSAASVYLEQYVPLFRDSPRWLDRLWDSKPMLTLARGRLDLHESEDA